MNKTTVTNAALVQQIADNYARMAGKRWIAEKVSVEYAHSNSARPKECFNNAYRHLLHGDAGMKYVLGFVIYCGVPIEHAWVRHGEKYIDTTLQSGEYIKVVELDEAALLKFILRHHYAPSLYDAAAIVKQAV